MIRTTKYDRIMFKEEWTSFPGELFNLTKPDVWTSMSATCTPLKLSSYNCEKAKIFLVLLLVNSILFFGIFVAASRRMQDQVRTSPLPPNHINPTTPLGPTLENTTENVRIQPVILHNLPKEIQDALMKVHLYMELKVNENSASICQFAWKLDKADNSVNLFICG